MSQRRDRVEAALSDIGFDTELLAAYYHLPLLLLLLVFMLWNRVRYWERFVDGKQVLYNGNDAWYHFRATSWTVRNWPFTIPFDPWTGFPVGNFTGQFGTLFDQLVATAALVIGLGSPSEHTVAMTLLFAPAVIGTLAAIPIYVIARRLGGRPAGLLAVLVLAMTPGSFLRRSLVGFSDHHIAEAFFLATAVAVGLVAVGVAESERPIWELVEAREWGTLRRPALWSVLAGVSLTLYLWTWPPGVLLIAIFGTFYLIKLTADYLRGESPDHLAFVAIVSMAVVFLLTVLTLDVVEVRATALSMLQPMFALAVGVGAVSMALLARIWDGYDFDPRGYPVTIGAILLVGAGVIMLTLPEFFDFLLGQAGRVVGYEATAASRTVGEAQPVPLENVGGFFYRSYGLAFVAAIGGLLLGVWKVYSDGPRGELLFVVLLGLFMTAATLTQRRFDYYLAIPVAVLAGYLLSSALTLVDLEAVDGLTDIETYQVLAILTILILVVGPFVSFSGNAPDSATLSPLTVADGTGPGEVRQWDASLRWLANETPAEGRYGAPENEQLAYYGRFERTDDHAYGTGEYGVMSWWDYGHFITTSGERIPYANPFQQHARGAAVYLLEPDESNANLMLASADGEQTRYVMVDWKLAYPLSGKYTAPTAFYDNTGYPSNASRSLSSQDLFRAVFDSQTGRFGFALQSQRHYESMRTRLYQYHGSARDPEPIVVDYELVRTNGREVAVTPSGQDSQTVRQFGRMAQARQFVEDDGTAQVGGIAGFPQERVSALTNYRLVKVSQSSAFRSRRFQQVLAGSARSLGLCQTQPQCLQVGQGIQDTPPQWVKTFERVPGATVDGSAPPNTTVTAEVELRMTSINQTFTYKQRSRTDADGQFTMTLPYASTGYQEYGVAEGYTNTSIRATGPYRFTTPAERNASLYLTQWSATAPVSEGRVIGADDRPVTVTLEKTVLDAPEGANGDASSSRLARPQSSHAGAAE